MGFAFKLHDYFAPDVLNLPFLDPFALPMAVVIVIFEVVLGVALLLGSKPRLVTGLLLAMIVFFTFLTFYSAYFNKVTDCGCFGDAIPLTPWQSFYKDIILLFFILVLYGFRKQIEPLGKVETRRKLLGGSILLSGILAYIVLNHLPFIDFRAYKVGNSIPEGMRSAEELGLEPPKFITNYTLQNASGEEVEVDSDRYVAEKWWEKTEWVIQEDLTTSKQISEGYEPPIHDFVLSTDEAGDLTDSILALPEVVLFVSYKLEASSAEGLKKAEAFYTSADGLPVYLVSASLPEVVEQYRSANGLTMPALTCDETTLKTIIRSNPGMVYLQQGVISGKWAWKDLPTLEALQTLKKP